MTTHDEAIAIARGAMPLFENPAKNDSGYDAYGAGYNKACLDIEVAISAYLDAMEERGWSLMPHEATRDMNIEGWQSIRTKGTPEEIYQDMTNAAPNVRNGL